MASSGQLSEIPHLVALIKTLTNPNLKDLLRNEGLAVSGVKASLQLRIIDCSYLFVSLGFFPLPVLFSPEAILIYYLASSVVSDWKTVISV